MQKILSLISLILWISSCTAPKLATTIAYDSVDYMADTLTQSLFIDKNATISEENIHKILDGNYVLPAKVRLAILKFDNSKNRYYWNDEDYIKNQQLYIDILQTQLKKSEKITRSYVLPDMIIPKNQSITNLREVGVRTQADLVLIFSTVSDIYTKYKVFGKTEMKAFATTQVLLLDIRTGLIPFTHIVTKDFFDKKGENDIDFGETRKRIESEAIKLTMEEIGLKVAEFLK